MSDQITFLDPISGFFSRVSRSVPFSKKKDPRRGGGPIIHVLGYGVPVGFFTGFSFIPPLGRQPHGPSPSGLSLRHGASQTYRRLSDISSERRAHLVQLVVQLSGLFERVQAEGVAGVSKTPRGSSAAPHRSLFSGRTRTFSWDLPLVPPDRPAMQSPSCFRRHLFAEFPRYSHFEAVSLNFA